MHDKAETIDLPACNMPHASNATCGSVHLSLWLVSDNKQLTDKTGR